MWHAVVRYLLERCKAKEFDANKLAASELLSILLQAHPRVPSLLHRLSDLDGLDTLLQAIAVYRKKDVTLADEQVLRLCLCVYLW
jgi:beta-catenin-like protein 1